MKPEPSIEAIIAARDYVINAEKPPALHGTGIMGHLRDDINTPGPIPDWWQPIARNPDYKPCEP